jgi:hypothetical protein
MSINVGQLFVEHDNLKLILRVVAEYVRVWQKGIFSRLSTLEKQEQGAENFLTRRARRISILPPANGWAMIVEQVRFLADGDLARHLSEGLGCRVIWSEVQGGALGWACFEFENGKLTGGRLEPAAGREERLVAAATEAKAVNLAQTESPAMPLYPLDAEQDAWNHLLGLGLPRDYIFLYPGDILRLDKGGELEAAFVVLRASHYGGRMTAAIGPAKLLPRPAGMPYRPDLVARSGDQPTCVHEVRLVHGSPTRQAIERIFAAELKWRRRGFQVMSKTLGGYVPEVSFRYKDPVVPDRDLDDIVSKHREASSSSFIGLTGTSQILSRKGFAARAADIVNDQDKSLEPVVDQAGNLTVKLGEDHATLDLRGAYRRYLGEPPTLETLAADALESYRRRRQLSEELSAADRHTLLLLPQTAGTELPDSVTSRLGDELLGVLAVERDGGILEVPHYALEALELDAETAICAARDRIASLAASAEPVAGVAGFGRVEVDPPLPAASLLAWPGLAEKLTGTTEGAQVIAAPSSGVLFYAPFESAGAAEFLAAVEEEFDSAIDPISERVFKLDPSGPVAL